MCSLNCFQNAGSQLCFRFFFFFNSHGEGFWFTCTWKKRFQRKLSDKKSSVWSGMVCSGMVIHQGFHVVGSGVHVSSTSSAHRQIYEANQSFCLTAFRACPYIWGAWKVHYHDDFVAGGGTSHPCWGVRPGHTEAQGTLSYDVSVYDY